jgi:hypothetical protein
MLGCFIAFMHYLVPSAFAQHEGVIFATEATLDLSNYPRVNIDYDCFYGFLKILKTNSGILPWNMRPRHSSSG